MNTQNTFNELKPSARIGKNGFTQTVIDEVNKHLKKKKIIKIKLLRSFVENKDKNILFKEIEKKLDAKVLEKKGFTITLYKDIKQRCNTSNN